MTSPPQRRTTSTARRVTSAAALAAAVLALVVACWSGPRTEDTAPTPNPAVTERSSPESGQTPGRPSDVASSDAASSNATGSPPPSTSTATTAAAAAPAPSSAVANRPTAGDAGSLPTTVQPVAPGEVVAFQVRRQGVVILDAASSGLARYGPSTSCEVPGRPCYAAPTFDKVARIDLGAAPQVPGTQTTFITGHANRYRPDDASKGVFSALANVQPGDTAVVRTTSGTFVYAVTMALSVPFDELTTTPEVVTVRKDTVVAIGCVIAPDHESYLGNYVVVGTLRASAPA